MRAPVGAVLSWWAAPLPILVNVDVRRLLPFTRMGVYFARGLYGPRGNFDEEGGGGGVKTKGVLQTCT